MPKKGKLFSSFCDKDSVKRPENIMARMTNLFTVASRFV